MESCLTHINGDTGLDTVRQLRGGVATALDTKGALVLADDLHHLGGILDSLGDDDTPGALAGADRPDVVDAGVALGGASSVEFSWEKVGEGIALEIVLC